MVISANLVHASSDPTTHDRWTELVGPIQPNLTDNLLLSMNACFGRRVQRVICSWWSSSSIDRSMANQETHFCILFCWAHWLSTCSHLLLDLIVLEGFTCCCCIEMLESAWCIAVCTTDAPLCVYMCSHRQELGCHSKSVALTVSIFLCYDFSFWFLI